MTAARARTSAAGPRQRRPSRRTFLVRRIIVLLAVFAIVGGLVFVAKTLVGSDASEADGQPISTATSGAPILDPGGAATTLSTSGALDPSIADPSVADPSLSDPSLTATSIIASTLPDAGRTPTAADPARVLMVGDSEAGGLSPFLNKALKATGVAALSTDYKSSTGLVRPDFYDWPARLQVTVPVSNPDIVVAVFGGNDGQSFLSSDAAAGVAAGKSVDSPEWRAEYGKRVAVVMDFLSADGRTLVWVGVPNGSKPDLTAALTVQNDVVKDQAAKHPNVIFVDSWSRFVGINGNFASEIADPRDGVFKPVRSADGFHLNKTGEEILAFLVGTAVDNELHTRGGVF